MKRNSRDVKKLPGGKGVIDESSAVDIGLLPLRKSDEQPTFARSTVASALSPTRPKLPRQTGMSKPKEAPKEKKEPPLPQDLVYEVVSKESISSLEQNETPALRYVYEEYVYGEKGKEPSGAHYTYKEKYEHKPKKEKIRPVDVDQPKVVKPRYMQFRTEGQSRLRSTEKTPPMPILARNVKSFEQAVRMDNQLEKLHAEITANLKHIVDADGPHTLLNGVEIAMPIDWNAVLGIDFTSAPTAEKVNTGGDNDLSPKALNEKLKKKKHVEANKRLLEKIKKVESTYGRDKQMKKYKEAKQRAPEPRFPPPKSKFKAKPVAGPSGTTALKRVNLPLRPKSKSKSPAAAIAGPSAPPGTTAKKRVNPPPKSKSKPVPVSGATAPKWAKSGPNMSRPAIPLFVGVTTSLPPSSKFKDPYVDRNMRIPLEDRLFTPSRAFVGAERPPTTISNYFGKLWPAYDRQLRSPSEITHRANVMIDEYRKDILRGKFF